jgi:peptidoglycan/LPS O-acetylase OafA/YrhL
VSEGLSDFLNFARWWAAFAVLLGHARSILFVDYHMIESPGFGDDLFYFLSGFGYEAVLIFFVMSGFLVGGKALEKIRDADFSIKLYAVDRFSRLYSVYVLALILTYLCDSLGGYFFAESKLYGGELQGVIAAIDGSFTERHSWPIFFGNLFMLQTIVVPTFGSNGPLWSLANESVYYILGPISFMALFWLRGAKRAIGISVIFVCLVSLPFGIAYGFIIWLAGAVFVYSGKSHWLFLPVGFGLLLGSLVVVRIDIGIPQYDPVNISV